MGRAADAAENASSIGGAGEEGAADGEGAEEQSAADGDSTDSADQDGANS